jgi:Ca2+/H+ antiporter, TMEM165/GDT1 family
MDALIPALVAVLLAEIGGKNQNLAHRAAIAGMGVGRIVAALIVTLAVGLGISAFGGSYIARLLTPDARLLLAALALLFAGVPMLLPMRGKDKPVPRHLVPAFATSQFGDSAQFIVFALAARGDMPVLAATGGIMGGLVAVLPPLLLGRDWPGKVPVSTLRLVAALLLIAAGLWLAVRALRLVA